MKSRYFVTVIRQMTSFQGLMRIASVPTSLCVLAGQGGNDLLGSREQVADQKLDRGNLALVSLFAERFWALSRLQYAAYL